MEYKKIIIIIGLGWQQYEYITYLKKKKYFLVGIDHNDNNSIKKKLNVFILEDIFNIDAIYLKLQKLNIIKPYKIVSFLSDTCELAADKLRKKFNLKSDLYEDINLALNKESQSKILNKRNICIPKTNFISSYADLKNCHYNYPLIIKPADSSGSRGVMKVESKITLKKDIIKSIFFSKKKRILLQEYIPGQEYSIEAVFSEKTIKIILISKRYKKKYVSAKMILPVNLGIKKKQLFEKYLLKICKVLKFKNCFIHAEIIIYKNNLYLVDISPRVGGFMIDKFLLPNYTGSNIYEFYANFSLGIKNVAINLKSKFIYTALVFIFKNINFLKLQKKQNKFIFFYSLSDFKNFSKLSFNDANRTGIFLIKCKNKKNLQKQINKIKNL